MAERYAWVTSPGNYGGNWCSPAPLYRQLAPKKNASARTIDMTSFDFVTATCGNCHPGGGPLEFDRDGKRYDALDARSRVGPRRRAARTASTATTTRRAGPRPGSSRPTACSATCPSTTSRSATTQLASLNFRWAATAGAGFGTVDRQGGGEREADGRLRQEQVRCGRQRARPHRARAAQRDLPQLPRQARLEEARRRLLGRAPTSTWWPGCAAWIATPPAAGPPTRASAAARCTSSARATTRPGWVRNDLDNTVRTCESCHLEGWRNAPRATHAWLPPLHMDKIACQTCHIPDARREERAGSGERRLQSRAPHHAAAEAHLDLLRPGDGVLEPLRRAGALHGQGRADQRHPADARPLQGQDLSRRTASTARGSGSRRRASRG